jgi:hypothetical protein
LLGQSSTLSTKQLCYTLLPDIIPANDTELRLLLPNIFLKDL